MRKVCTFFSNGAQSKEAWSVGLFLYNNHLRTRVRTKNTLYTARDTINTALDFQMSFQIVKLNILKIY